MPIRLNDTRLGSLDRSFEAQKRTNPNLKLGNEQIIACWPRSVIAAVGPWQRRRRGEEAGPVT
jgi:hypothetical protein